MRKILTVARNEYVETVKTKTFLIGVLVMPLLLVGIIVFSVRVTAKSITGPAPPKRVAVTDLTGELGEELERVFGQHNASNSQRQVILKHVAAQEPNTEAHIATGKADVRSGALDAFVVIAVEALEGQGTSQFYTRKVTDLGFFATVRNLVNQTVQQTRLRRHDLDPELIAQLRRTPNMEQVDLSTETEKRPDTFVALMVPFAFVFLMYMGVIGTSMRMVMSLLEEKSSRVIEVLLSAVTPLELMAGKIVGLAAVGLTLVGVWAAVGCVGVTLRGLEITVSAGIVVYFVIYYVLGFLLASSMLAGLGSTCNTMKEAQGIMFPFVMLWVLPMIAWQYVAQHPDGTLAVVLSFIPPITPLIMILRIAARPDLSLLQIVATIVVLAASVPACIWASAKVFRVGVLMYGKPPSLREIGRWLRYR